MRRANGTQQPGHFEGAGAVTLNAQPMDTRHAEAASSFLDTTDWGGAGLDLGPESIVFYKRFDL